MQKLELPLIPKLALVLFVQLEHRKPTQEIQHLVHLVLLAHTQHLLVSYRAILAPLVPMDLLLASQLIHAPVLLHVLLVNTPLLELHQLP